jgi:hypothetical protein
MRACVVATRSVDDDRGDLSPSSGRHGAIRARIMRRRVTMELERRAADLKRGGDLVTSAGHAI